MTHYQSPNTCFGCVVITTATLSILMLIVGCGTTTSGAGGDDSTTSTSSEPTESTTSTSTTGGADNGKLGAECPCPGNVSTVCENVGDGSGCSSGLTCFGSVDNDANGNPVNHATCTKSCTQDPMTNTSDCASGFDCVDFVISEADRGSWCEKQ